MPADLLGQVIGLEYKAVALLAAPLTSLVVGRLLRYLLGHLQDRRVAAYAARLVAWAEQSIPEKSARYAEVAALLSRRFPALTGAQLEVLIESEVRALRAISVQRSAISGTKG